MVNRSAWIVAAVAVAATGIASGVAIAIGAGESVAVVLGIAVGVALFVGIVAAFIVVPHVAVALAIPYFAVLPALKLFVSPVLGGTKDLVALAAVVAAAVVYATSRRNRREPELDRGVVLALALLLLLYALNIGGALSGESGYGRGWFQGVRLVGEPLALLVAGMVLPRPTRTLRWAITSLAATGAVVAGYGLVQQVLGVDRLLDLGYRYGQEVRQIGSLLRSFGTLDEPFAYAAFLLLCAVVLLFGFLRSVRAYALLVLIGCGVAVAFVRSAALSVVALLAIALLHQRKPVIASLAPIAVVACTAAIVVIAAISPSEGLLRSVPLQERTELWRQAVGDSPAEWLLGRGVGTVGTASQRASEPFVPDDTAPATRGTVVDSSYVVAIADVGIVGLLVLLALFLRLLVLARAAALRGEDSGWIVLGVLTVMLLDALTRESLTGFPFAYLGMLLVGVAAATWPKQPPAPAASGDTAFNSRGGCP